MNLIEAIEKLIPMIDTDEPCVTCQNSPDPAVGRHCENYERDECHEIEDWQDLTKAIAVVAHEIEKVKT